MSRDCSNFRQRAVPLEAWRGLQRQRLQAAETALAATEGGERLGEVGRLEFGPHSLGEVQLRIGAFPQQEVREPLLAGGADDEVDIAQRRLAGDELREGFAGEA